MGNVKSMDKPKVAPELTVSLTEEDVKVFNNVFQAAIEKFAGHRQSVINVVNLEQKLATIIQPHIEQPNGN